MQSATLKYISCLLREQRPTSLKSVWSLVIDSYEFLEFILIFVSVLSVEILSYTPTSLGSSSSEVRLSKPSDSLLSNSVKRDFVAYRAVSLSRILYMFLVR